MTPNQGAAMITMPEDVLSTDESGGWDGRSEDPNTGIEHPNTESAMSWAEHQRIVCAARSLLTGQIEISPADVKKAFRELQSAYNDPASRSVVKVSKGIHQPTVNPHLQMRLVSSFYQGQTVTEVVRLFHLDVSAVDSPDMTDRFQWKGVQFSFVHGNQSFKWPLAATPIIKKTGRRQSVSEVDLAAHLHGLELERQRLAQEQAKALEKSRLAGLLGTYGIDKSNLNKLLNGRSVPGRDGAYQYGKNTPGVLAFQKTGSKGYVDI
jgi:hypothetical protein